MCLADNAAHIIEDCCLSQISKAPVLAWPARPPPSDFGLGLWAPHPTAIEKVAAQLLQKLGLEGAATG